MPKVPMILAGFAVGLALLSVSPAWGQIDIAGDWDQPGPASTDQQFMEDAEDRGPGPSLGDYTGLPLNAAARYRALSYSPSWLMVPEHQCAPQSSTYAFRGPGNLSIVKIYDRATERLTAYEITGNYGLARTIWMDGRARPPENSPHTWEGFSVGRWEGDKLVVETTHLRASWIRRDGAPLSDRTRMIEYFIRHDNVLTVTTAVDDPVYLDEPLVLSSDFRRNLEANTQLMSLSRLANEAGGPEFHKCSPADEEAGERWAVPHYLPGTNKAQDEFVQKRHVPTEAALGGAMTIYPDYLVRLRQLVFGNSVEPLVPPPIAAPVAQPTPRTPVTRSAAVTSQHIAGQVWMLTAGTTNVTVQIGREGVFVVDPGPAGLAGAVLAEINRLSSGKPIRMIVNTSSDPAVAGGNARLGAPVDGPLRAAVIAHENTSSRMSNAGLPSEAIPTEVFFRDRHNVYFNDEPIEVLHVPAAYSDGDVLVLFRKSNVVVAGHIIEDLTYPVLGAGGSLNGILDALNRILQMTVAEWRTQGGTYVIPVHGRPYDQADVAEYRDMVAIVRDRVKAAISDRKTLDQLGAARITRDYDGRYGAPSGPASAAGFLDAAYRDLSAQQAAK